MVHDILEQRERALIDLDVWWRKAMFSERGVRRSMISAKLIKSRFISRGELTFRWFNISCLRGSGKEWVMPQPGVCTASVTLHSSRSHSSWSREVEGNKLNAQFGESSGSPEGLEGLTVQAPRSIIADTYLGFGNEWNFKRRGLFISMIYISSRNDRRQLC